MSKEEVIGIQEAGRRARALQTIIDESIKRNLRQSARIAQRDLEDLRKEIYQQYDILL